MTRNDLFISHSSADAGAARELRTLLESAGYTCWMAPDDVTGTDPWAQQILAAIEDSRAMLVLISERSNRSLHVSREVELASSRGRIILPVRVEPIKTAGALEYHLAGLQRIDVFPLPVGNHRAEILRRLAANVPLAAPSDGEDRAPVAAVTRSGSLPPRDVDAEDAAPRKRREGRGLSAWARANSMVAGSIVTLAALFIVATLGFALSSPKATTSPGPIGSATLVVPSASVASTKPPTPSPTAASTFAPPQSGFPVASGGPFPNVAERALFDALPDSAKSVIEACDRHESRYDASVVGITCHAGDELLFYEGYADHTTQYRQYLDVVRQMNNPEGSCSTSPGGDEAWSRPDGRFGHLACGVTDSDLFFFFWTDESRLFSISWYSGYEVNLSVERAKGYQVFLDWTGG